MGIKIVYILTALVVLSFFITMFFVTGDRNKLFIKYVLLAYPFVSISLLPNLGSFNTIFDCITLIFALIFYTHKSMPLHNGKMYFYFFVILTVTSIIGIVSAEGVSTDTATAVIQYITTFVFARILCEECLADEDFFYSVINCLKIVLVFSLAFLVCQLFFGVNFTFAKSLNLNVTGGDRIRYPSFFQDPQKYSQFIAVTSILFLIKNKEQTKLPLLNYAVILCSIVAMMFTGGRAGFLGWGIGVLMILLFGSVQHRVVAIISAVAIFIVVYNFSDVFAMFNRTSTVDDSYEVRSAIWVDAIGIFKDHPMFGIGMGNYANYVAIHNPDQYWLADNEIIYFNHPENGYLKFLTEGGGIGFVAILVFILLPVLKGVYVFLKTKDIDTLILVAAIVSWLVGFYTLYSFDDTRIRILIITLICLLITKINFNWRIQDAEE
jgi:hypothetical protein